MGGMSSVHLLGKAPGRVRTQQRDEDHQRRERQAHGVNEHDRAERPAQREDKLDPQQTHHANADHRQNGRPERDAEAAQIAGHDLIQKREDIGEEHDLQPVIAQRDDLWVVVEDGQQEAACQQHQRDGRAERNGVFDQAEVQRFAAAADLARAVVLADKRRAGLIIGVHHVIGEDFDVVGGARGCHNDLAEAVDGGLDDDVGNGEHRALQSGGQADAQDHPQTAAVHAQVARLKADVLAGAQQAAEQQSRAEGIGHDGRDGHAVDGHMEHGNEEQVQQHVQHAGHRQRHERHTRLADAAEDRRLEVIKQDDRHAHQVDAQIQQRLRKHVVRHMQRAQQGGSGQLAERGDDNAAQQGKHDGGVHGLLHGLAVAAADGVCDDDIRAEGDADEQVDDERDERAVCADGGDGNGLVRAGEVADNGNVGGVEQLFQNGCCGDRQGKLRQLAPDRAVEHVEPLAFCGSHVEFLLSIQKHLDCGPSIAQSAPQRKHFSGFSQTLEDCTGTARRMEPFPCSLFRGCGQMSEERGRNQYTPGMRRMSSSNTCRSVSCMQHGK